MPWAILTAVLLLGGPSPLFAQSAAADPSTTASFRMIRVSLIGAEPPSAFSERIASWFESDTRVEVHHQPRLDPEHILGAKQRGGVYVWIELRSSHLARVYFAVAEADAPQRFLLRDVVLEDGMDELGVERLAQVLYSSVVALSLGHVESPQAEVKRQLESTATDSPPPPVITPPSATTSEPTDDAPDHASPCRALGYAVGAGYGANSRGDEGLAHGPQVWTALLAGCGRTRLGGFLSGRHLILVEQTARDVTLDVTGGRVRFGGMLQHAGGKAFRLELGVGLGVDVIHYEPTVSAELTAEAAATEARPVSIAVLGSSLLAGGARIAVFGELDVPLQDTHYDVARQTGLQTAIKPWRVQPGISALVRFDGPSQ